VAAARLTTVRFEGSRREVFAAFLKLGLTAFGGPTAHIGYFRREMVERRRWLTEAAFAELVALCQLLPGPSSSQTGFALGLMRAGPIGGLAAWTAFTLPSALLMILFAYGADTVSGSLGAAIIHGLKLVAVPIVAHAVIGMARTLTPDVPRAGIALLAVGAILLIDLPATQLGVIALGAVCGLFCNTPAAALHRATGWTPGRRTGRVCLAAFAILLVASLTLGFSEDARLALAAILYRAGALVFGGGHVILPLLRSALVPQWIDDRSFLAGYGFAQAVPGPLFSFGAYLGVRIAGAGGAAIAIAAIFLPGLLLVTAALPLRAAVQGTALVRRAIAGVNAAVVGILAAALYNPLWRTGVTSIVDMAIVAAGMVLLWRWRAPALLVVALTLAGSIAASRWG
jgi:chromate transporter